jgi:hypothetical protein
VPNWIHNQRLHFSSSQTRMSIYAYLYADIFFSMSVRVRVSVSVCLSFNVNMTVRLIADVCIHTFQLF